MQRPSGVLRGCRPSWWCDAVIARGSAEPCRQRAPFEHRSRRLRLGLRLPQPAGKRVPCPAGEACGGRVLDRRRRRATALPLVAAAARPAFHGQRPFPGRARRPADAHQPHSGGQAGRCSGLVRRAAHRARHRCAVCPHMLADRCREPALATACISLARSRACAAPRLLPLRVAASLAGGGVAAGVRRAGGRAAG